MILILLYFRAFSHRQVHSVIFFNFGGKACMCSSGVFFIKSSKLSTIVRMTPFYHYMPALFIFLVPLSVQYNRIIALSSFSLADNIPDNLIIPAAMSKSKDILFFALKFLRSCKLKYRLDFSRISSRLFYKTFCYTSYIAQKGISLPSAGKMKHCILGCVIKVKC